MDESQFNTAIAFFIFNRPETTQLVFDEIKKIKPKKLFIIADGPRNYVQGEYEKCMGARAIIDTVDWTCDVLKNFSETNLGCKVRISSGISWVFEHVEEAIILEDDCVPDPSFFPFCQIMLKQYSDDKRIMMISGSNFVFENEFFKDTYYFSQYFPIWGWATWKRAWEKYDIDMVKWPEFKKEKVLDAIFPNKLFVHYFERIFDDVYGGRDDTWDAQWVFTCLTEGGLCIMPSKNLVSNIGISGTRVQMEKLIGKQRFSLDLARIKDPDFFLVNPTIQEYEMKKLLEMARYSYLKYYATKILKKLKLFDFVEKIYLDKK